MAPVTRSQQQALGPLLDMASNTPTTPMSAAVRTADVPDQPDDIPATNNPVSPTDSVMLALQRSLDRISERLDDMDSRLQKIEGPDEQPEVARVDQAASTPSPTRAGASSQPLHSTPSSRGNVLPPHLISKESSRVVAKDPPRAREVFRTLSTPQKDVFRTVLDQMGTSIFEFLDCVPDAILPDPPVSSGEEQTTVRTAVDPVGTVSGAGDISLPSSNAPRLRICKPEYLPEFGGDPYKLDRFLTRVHDIIRNDPDPAWERAVLHALPIKLVDDAEEWHSGLSDEESKAIGSFEDLEAAMRLQFPMNYTEQRRLAHERKWVPTAEQAGTYYFAKLRVLRAAFGKDQSDTVLARYIIDGLPATFRAMIRLPRTNILLTDLRAEIGDWEPTWREMHPQLALRRPAASASAPQSAASSSAVKPAATKQNPTAGPPPAPSTAASGGSSRPLSLAATYDRARVIPAADGKPRRYRRPGDDVVIELNRPCTRCGDDHFNFEHPHLVPTVQTMGVDEDSYPEVEDETAGSSSF
ncbi:hypothetical protein CF319_g8110 [Tilletia indica]|uniref:Retrotransposon gag domain-containing protein n=1 Tax=Tilletia indica TaxID=43049 RepID=A0A177TB06_9BASI|nr:hypothetical protein CF319_g8110 [Tilletia indica]KAE8240434.1 hypothetical protein A4X13_0g7809 [Tilletia indica]